MKILFKLNPYLQQRQKEKCRWIFPIKLAMSATHLRNQGHEIVWDGELDESVDKIVISEDQIDIPFLELPSADRTLTDAKNEKWQKNGNFKYHPGTYIQSASSCWWGRCSFCSEKDKPYQVRPVESIIQELEEIKRLGFRECFDDSGTFPVGSWLDELLSHPKPNIVLGCNCRMVEYPWKRMKDWGFRMILFGLESANQSTLNKINKGTKVEDIKHIIEASKAGLEPHICTIFGYPFETDEDAETTLRTVHYLLKNGYAKTAQASFYQNPPEVSNERHRHYVRRIYDVAYSSQFWFNKIRDVKSVEDIKYLWRQMKEGLWNLKK